MSIEMGTEYAWDDFLPEECVAGLAPEGQEAMRMFVMSLSAKIDQPHAETFAQAVAEQKLEGIQFRGFDQDLDFRNLASELETVFGQDLLNKCLISKLNYYPDDVMLDNQGKHYAIPSEDYKKAIARRPDIAQYRFRSFSSPGLNRKKDAKKYLRLPIAVYNLDGEPLSNKDYLPKDADEQTKIRLYKLGTVVHEVAHHIWHNVLGDGQRGKWSELNVPTAHLTHNSRQHSSRPAWHEEHFAESIRIMATNPDYLAKNNKPAHDFVENELPLLGQIRL